jgi:outer membrane biosynthesis protein TonB
MHLARSLPAFAAISLALHGALTLLPGAAALAERLLHADARPPESVAMNGTSMETDAPSPNLAGTPPGAAEGEIEVDTSLEPPDERAATPPEPAAALPQSLPSEPALPAAERAPPTSAPKPRPPAPKPRRAPATPRAPAGAAAPAATVAGAPAAGTFGAEGLAPSVRRLGYAFTRAIPAATPSDTAWRELPAGSVGTIRIELSVDPEGRLGPLELWRSRPGEPEPPGALLRMVQRTLLLLRAGQFALSGSNGAGRERLTIEVRLRDDAPDEEPTQEVVQKKFDGARPGHPGTASFRYGTGRVFEAKVTTTPAPN